MDNSASPPRHLPLAIVFRRRLAAAPVPPGNPAPGIPAAGSGPEDRQHQRPGCRRQVRKMLRGKDAGPATHHMGLEPPPTGRHRHRKLFRYTTALRRQDRPSALLRARLAGRIRKPSRLSRQAHAQRFGGPEAAGIEHGQQARQGRLPANPVVDSGQRPRPPPAPGNRT